MPPFMKLARFHFSPVVSLAALTLSVIAQAQPAVPQPVPETLDENAPRESSPWRITAHAYAVTALNPKSIVFYVAFFPLFLSAELPLLPQVVVLGGTFLVMATVNAILYALLAGQVTRFLKGYRARKNLNRTAGGILLVTGGLLGIARRSA